MECYADADAAPAPAPAPAAPPPWHSESGLLLPTDFDAEGPYYIPPDQCNQELETSNSMDSVPVKDLTGWSFWKLPNVSKPEEEKMDSFSEYDSNENMLEESSNEDNNEFLGGGPEPKRRKLELDPNSSSSSSGESSCQRESKRLHLEKPDPKKILDFILNLNKCNIKHNSVSGDILENMRQCSLLNLDDNIALYWIERRIGFHRKICNIRALYDAVKNLYENSPYISSSDTLEEAKKRMMKSNPKAFEPLRDFEIYEACRIHEILLRQTEIIFNPLLRKSCKEEFFSLVETKNKLAEREFIMTSWRYELLQDSLMLKHSCDKGLHDENYEHCCEQIRLQERFDCYLHYRAKVTHNSVIEDLIDDKAIVTEEFKYLNPELIQLSLEACIKNRKQDEEVRQCFLQLQSLENARRKKETHDIDIMLKSLHQDFPWIIAFPKEKRVDNDLEQRFKSAIYKIKEMWFPKIAEHYVAEATLLYLENLVLQSNKDDPYWPTTYLKERMFHTRFPRPVCHEHDVYDRVLGVEYSLA